jgi:hypothetical protein
MRRFTLHRRFAYTFITILGCATLLVAAPSQAATAPANQLRTSATAFLPGTGTCVDYVSDDFEEAGWKFNHRMPKSSREQDQAVRGPMGNSSNDRWHEGPERGQPDQIQVTPTPPGGLPGSQHALLLRTLHSGVPGYNSYDVQQDDLIANSLMRLRGGIPVSERPSVTVRVYLPPAEQWEKRSGPQFGFRSSVSTLTTGKTAGIFSWAKEDEVEAYWPGMWIHFRAKGTRGNKVDSAYIAVRGDRLGRDFYAKEITQFGWWTFGMSFSPDGMVHYYAGPGVDPLTSADYITSQYPYSYTARQFRTYFFDVCNRNDGKSWSTPFVIDDPKLYLGDSRRVTAIVQRQLDQKREHAERLAAREEAMRKAKEDREARLAEQKELAKQRALARQQAAAEPQQAAEAEVEEGMAPLPAPKSTAMRQPVRRRATR